MDTNAQLIQKGGGRIQSNLRMEGPEEAWEEKLTANWS